MTATPVTLASALGRPVTNVQNVNGAVPMTVVDALGEPVTLVDRGGEPVTLLNPDGTLWGDLYRILALSPSLLIWPANGSGWQGTSGGTLSAIGQPVGLLPDLAQLQGKTQAEWLAAPTTASEIANGVVGLAGTATAATYNTGTGAGSVSRVDFSNQSYVVWETLGTQPRYLRVECLTGTLEVRQGLFSNSSVASIAAGSTVMVVLAPSGGRITLTHTTSAGTATFTVHEFRELPGNHLRAGTWATPVDAARATLRAGGGLDFDGTADYYSLLNAINITENMTVVRAFKRSAAGIRSIGLGSGSWMKEFTWQATNNIFLALSDGGQINASGGTGTGSFVASSRRNVTTQSARRNGVEVMTGAVGTLPASFNAVGLSGADYNSGEISFLAVFPTELTGANLALVEQIAAATNGTTLA